MGDHEALDLYSKLLSLTEHFLNNMRKPSVAIIGAGFAGLGAA